MPQLPSPPVAEGVVIRPERDADHSVIAEVVRTAFVGHPDEVASFVERIRASEQFIPELALVAEDSSGVIAHVMLSWVGVEGGSRTRILNLTPMSVRPDRQRIGVGARLIRDALGRAEEAGEPAVMVEGIPAYYPRFGFEQASALGFISPHRVLSSLRLRAGERARLHLPASEDPRRRFHGQAAPGIQPRPRRSDRLSGRVRRSRVLATGPRRAAHSAGRNVSNEVPERRLETLGCQSVLSPEPVVAN